MAKGQQRKPKEAKKPKADQQSKGQSAYAQAYKQKPGSFSVTPPKKDG